MPPRFVPTPSPRCPRCTKAVYLAEQVIGPNGTSWHKSCFTCERCNRRLDSTTLAEHEGKAYCQACHKLVFGPTGYGYGSGLLPPMYLSQYLKQQRQKERDQASSPSGPPSLPKRNPEPVRTQAGSGSVEADEWDEEPTPTVPSKPANLSYYQSTPAPIKKAHPVFGGGDICRSCQKVVYHAELARAHGSVYHKACLRCFSCQKSVDATNMVDRQGTPYCRHCYSREFGAKGYGYGAGGHVLHTEL
ncbi:hypothetical protein B0O80DRAFT_389012 [Mortierella sp. GBAus27b]|nr:hypothetical protein B0O80DRAFT_389012 [Mortierella sp. GBAus27b]